MTHETVIAAQIIADAEQQGEVQTITLDLGELGHVPPKELIECITRLRPEWNLQWTEKKARVRCAHCGFEGHPDILDRGHDYFMIQCPMCMEIPKVLSGTDFVLKSVVVK